MAEGCGGDDAHHSDSSDGADGHLHDKFQHFTIRKQTSYRSVVLAYPVWSYRSVVLAYPVWLSYRSVFLAHPVWLSGQ